MVYGCDYCASEECYSSLKLKVKSSVESIPDIDFTESKELGHINRVDPLGITYMRVRGMWGIENPLKVFNYVYKRNTEKDLSLMCIINDDKWNSFDNTDKLNELSSTTPNLRIDRISIKNPDNPAKLVSARLIKFEK